MSRSSDHSIHNSYQTINLFFQFYVGKTVRVSVVAVTGHAVGDSRPSDIVKVMCPSIPPAPTVTQQPSYKAGSVVLAWDRPAAMEHISHGEDIIMYR